MKPAPQPLTDLGVTVAMPTQAARFVSYRSRGGVQILRTELEGGASLLVPFHPGWAARRLDVTSLRLREQPVERAAR